MGHEQAAGDEGAGEGIDRREALKKAAVAAGAAGVVWAAPVIEGLSVRPDFAAAASQGGGGGLFTFDVPLPANTFFSGVQVTSPLGAFGNVTSDWAQDQTFGSATVKGQANTMPGSCHFSAINFDGRISPFEFDAANVNTPNGGTTIGNTNISATWLAGFDTSDDMFGGTAHVTVQCT